MLDQEIASVNNILEEAKKIPTSDHASINHTSLLLSQKILLLCQKMQSRKEKRDTKLLSDIIHTPSIKSALVTLTDRLFRVQSTSKTASLLLEKRLFCLSITNIRFWEKLSIRIAFTLISWTPFFAIPLLRRFVRSKMSRVMFEQNSMKFHRFLEKATSRGYKVSVNRLGEAILGEKEAKKRFDGYLEDIKNPLINGVSIKLSSLFVNLQPLDFQKRALPKMVEKLTELLDATIKSAHNPLITLDMEEYRDLFMTTTLVSSIASIPKVYKARIGIAIQAYIPDSSKVIEELITISKIRVENGGAPIYIRLVKGANLPMEKIESALKNWPEPTYNHKSDTDAHYIQLLHRLLSTAKKGLIEIGIASHNIYDIAYGRILSLSMGSERYVSYEMLQGMSPALTQAVLAIAPNKLMVYCPIYDKHDMSATIAYLLRRLDENATPGHFLPALSKALLGNTLPLKKEERAFLKSIEESEYVSTLPKRAPYSPEQNRPLPISQSPFFQNCPDIDWASPQNQEKAEKVALEWMNKETRAIPLIVNGQKIFSEIQKEKKDPSRPDITIYTHSITTKTLCQETILKMHQDASKSPEWSIQDKSLFLDLLAKNLEKKRFDYIGSMLQEVAKPIPESDGEVSEAIDFVDYYKKELISENRFFQSNPRSKLASVASPWNFPLSLSLQHILQALLTDHYVIFKPSPEAISTGFYLVETLLESGLDPSKIAFLPMNDEPEGTWLIQNPLIDTIFMTGSTRTARHFLQNSPSKRLYAETGGKNVAYLSTAADIDLAIRDIVRSAFSYSGQKCSALSVLLIDKSLLSSSCIDTLINAATSLIVDSAWNLTASVVPLIGGPSYAFQKAIHELEPGETWLLKPSQHSSNPSLYTPGIKLVEIPDTWSHREELFGPCLTIIPTYDIQDAIRIANSSQYGLTSGIYTLSDTEAKIWQERIEFGMVYINRPVVGALVGRQPFGGWKKSSFGIGMKIGGPFSLRELMTSRPIDQESSKTAAIPILSGQLLSFLGICNIQDSHIQSDMNSHITFARRAHAIWHSEFFPTARPLSNIQGQKNELLILPREVLYFIVQPDDPIEMIWAFMVMAATSSTRLIFSQEAYRILESRVDLKLLDQYIHRYSWQVMTSHKEMIDSIEKNPFPRVKTLQKMDDVLRQKISEYAFLIDEEPLSMDPRIDFLYFIKEKTISQNTHRYGTIQE